MQRPVSRCISFATTCWSLQSPFSFATTNRSLHNFLQRPFTRCKTVCNDRVLVALFLQRPTARCKLNATTGQSLHCICNDQQVVALYMQRAVGRCIEFATSIWSLHFCNDRLAVAFLQRPFGRCIFATTDWSLHFCNDRLVVCFLKVVTLSLSSLMNRSCTLPVSFCIALVNFPGLTFKQPVIMANFFLCLRQVCVIHIFEIERG